MATTKSRPAGSRGIASPSVATRFKKGVSGNPKGRPKGSANASKVLDKALRERVKVNVDGKQKAISKLEAMVTQLANKGALGDPRATQQVLTALHKLGEGIEETPPPKVLTETDQEIVANIVARILKSTTGDSNEPHQP